MAAVHAYIAYDRDRTTHLHSLTTTQLASALRNDLRALRILHPPTANISLTTNQIHFWWPKAGQNVWQGISNAIDRWFTEDEFREMQANRGIENVVLREPRTSPSSSATPPPPPPKSRKRARSPSPIQFQRAKRTRPELRSDRKATAAACSNTLDTSGPIPKLKKPQHFGFMHPSRVALLSQPTSAPQTKQEGEQPSLLASSISRKRARSSSPLSHNITKRPRQEQESPSAPAILAPKPTYPVSPLPTLMASQPPSQPPAPRTPPPPTKRRPSSRATPEWARTPRSSQILSPIVPFYTPTQSPAPLFKDAPPQSPTLEEGNQRIREWVAQTSKIKQEELEVEKEVLKEKDGEEERGRNRVRKSRFADRKTPPGSPQMLSGFPPLTRLAVPRVVPPRSVEPVAVPVPVSARVLGKRRARDEVSVPVKESVSLKRKQTKKAPAPPLTTPQTSTTLSSTPSSAPDLAPERKRALKLTAELYEAKVRLGWDPITNTWGESAPLPGPGATGRSMTKVAGEPSIVEKSVVQVPVLGTERIVRTSPIPVSNVDAKSLSPPNATTSNPSPPTTTSTSISPPTTTTDTTSPPNTTTTTSTSTSGLTPLLLPHTANSSTSLSESPLPVTPVGLEGQQVPNSLFWEVPKSPYHGVRLDIGMFPLWPSATDADAESHSNSNDSKESKELAKDVQTKTLPAIAEPFSWRTPKSPILQNSIFSIPAPFLTAEQAKREEEEQMLIDRYLSTELCAELVLTKPAYLEHAALQEKEKGGALKVGMDVDGGEVDSGEKTRKNVKVMAGKSWNGIGAGGDIGDGEDTLIRDTLQLHS